VFTLEKRLYTRDCALDDFSSSAQSLVYNLFSNVNTIAASFLTSRSLCLLILALFATVAQAGTFKIYDRWSYVSGTAVTWGGPVQSDVWHDATTRPLVVKLTLASFFSSSTTSPITAQASKKFIRLSSSTNFITVVGTTPQGGPVTTGFQVGAPQYYDYDASTNALAAIPASIEFLITFDSKTTDIAGTTFKLTYDCGALNNDINLVDTGSCISSKASPGFQTVKIGWVPVISIHEVTGTNSDVYEDVTGQWIDLARSNNPSGALPGHVAKKHVVRFAPQSGKQIFTGTQASAPSGFLQSWGNLAHQHIFGKPKTLDITSAGENVEDAWKKFDIRSGGTIPVTQLVPDEVTFSPAVTFAASFTGSISSPFTQIVATSVTGKISSGQKVTFMVSGTSVTLLLMELLLQMEVLAHIHLLRLLQQQSLPLP